MNTAERLDRLEQAAAELTQMVKGAWSPASARSAAGAILTEQRSVAAVAAEREARVRDEVNAAADAEVEKRLRAEMSS